MTEYSVCKEHTTPSLTIIRSLNDLQGRQLSEQPAPSSETPHAHLHHNASSSTIQTTTALHEAT